MWTCPKCSEPIEDQFDSCWNCAAATKPPDASPLRLSAKFFLLATPMSLLAPVLADCLQSVYVMAEGTRYYQAILSTYLTQPEGVVIIVGVRALITLALLRFLVKSGFRGRTVWLVLVALWLTFDFYLEPAAHK
jgi:hypothetical protein